MPAATCVPESTSDLVEDFRGPHSWLSNFHTEPLFWEGLRYPSAEAAFAAGKTLDARKRAQIAAAASPGEATRLGRQVPLRPGWDARVRYEVMDSVLAAKFSFAPLRERLVGTGSTLLVEGNTHHDDEWGHCHCPRHRSSVGRNMLGRALMRLRARLADTPSTHWARVSATGHRPQNLPRGSAPWVRGELARVAEKLRAEHGTRIAISGGALGVDLWWADAAHDAGHSV